MISFNEFKMGEYSEMNEAEMSKMEQTKLDLSKKFSEISAIKKAKKPGDVNSEIESLNKQSVVHLQISNLLKTLAAEIRANPDAGNTNIY